MQKDDGALVLENKVKLAQQDLTVSIQAMAQLFPALPSQAGHAMTDAKKPQKLFDKLLEYQYVCAYSYYAQCCPCTLCYVLLVYAWLMVLGTYVMMLLSCM